MFFRKAFGHVGIVTTISRVTESLTGLTALSSNSFCLGSPNKKEHAFFVLPFTAELSETEVKNGFIFIDGKTKSHNSLRRVGILSYFTS